jgi:hypothetical protein
MYGMCSCDNTFEASIHVPVGAGVGVIPYLTRPKCAKKKKAQHLNRTTTTITTTHQMKRAKKCNRLIDSPTGNRLLGY